MRGVRFVFADGRAGAFDSTSPEESPRLAPRRQGFVTRVRTVRSPGAQRNDCRNVELSDEESWRGKKGSAISPDEAETESGKLARIPPLRGFIQTSLAAAGRPSRIRSRRTFIRFLLLSFEPVPEKIVVQFDRTDVAAIGNVCHAWHVAGTRLGALVDVHR